MAHRHRDEVAETREALARAEEADVLPLDEAREKQARARRVEAMSLRMAGLTYEQIAERLKVSSSRAEQLVNDTLAAAENTQVARMRDLEGQRLDRAQAAIWTQVIEGDVKAVDAFLRISQRRARMFGLDQPAKVSLDVSVRTEMMNALADLERVVLGEVVHGAAGDADDLREIEG